MILSELSLGECRVNLQICKIFLHEMAMLGKSNHVLFLEHDILFSLRTIHRLNSVFLLFSHRIHHCLMHFFMMKIFICERLDSFFLIEVR